MNKLYALINENWIRNSSRGMGLSGRIQEPVSTNFWALVVPMIGFDYIVITEKMWFSTSKGFEICQ